MGTDGRIGLSFHTNNIHNQSRRAVVSLCLPKETVNKHHSTSKLSPLSNLHYNHKNSFSINLTELAKEQRVVLLYIPARCTDLIQVCDTVVNKTFKCGVKRAFQLYLHTEYEKYKSDPTNDPYLWKPNLNDGHLKQFMIKWINFGIDGMKSAAFAQTIKEAFLRDARHAS